MTVPRSVVGQKSSRGEAADALALLTYSTEDSRKNGFSGAFGYFQRNAAETQENGGQVAGSSEEI